MHVLPPKFGRLANYLANPCTFFHFHQNYTWGLHHIRAPKHLHLEKRNPGSTWFLALPGSLGGKKLETHSERGGGRMSGCLSGDPRETEGAKRCPGRTRKEASPRETPAQQPVPIYYQPGLSSRRPSAKILLSHTQHTHPHQSHSEGLRTKLQEPRIESKAGAHSLADVLP